jgi:hypothetical protein
LNVLPHVNLTLLLETTVLEYDQRKRDQQWSTKHYTED